MKQFFVILLCLAFLGAGSGKTYTSPSGRSYSSPGGKSSFHSTPHSSPHSSGSKFKSPNTKGFSPPSSPTKPSPFSSKSSSPKHTESSPSPISRKPFSSPFSKGLSDDAKKEQGELNYKKYKSANNPQPEHFPKESKPTQTRRYIPRDKYVTYDDRSRDFYRGYTPSRYNDHFSPFLMAYLLSLSANSRGDWVYHHWNSMDRARRDELMRDAELRARVERLEREQVARQSDYVLPGMVENPDLQYDKEYIKPESSGVLLSVFLWIVGISVFVFVVFLCFRVLASTKSKRSQSKTFNSGTASKSVSRSVAPVSPEFYNPLKAKPVSVFVIDKLDFRGCNFQLQEVREYVIDQSGRKQKFTDYTLKAIGNDTLATLRVTEVNEEPQAILLQKYDEFPFVEDFLKTVSDPTGELTAEDATYWRCEGVTKSYEAAVRVFVDLDKDGEITNGETKKEKVTFWDFSRSVEVDGVDALEYFFVELNNGYFYLNKGEELAIEAVSVL